MCKKDNKELRELNVNSCQKPETMPDDFVRFWLPMVFRLSWAKKL